jgi:hydroxyethylthiazole kinase-like uncharacterized protein yjeF
MFTTSSLYSVRQIRDIERRALAAVPSGTLMRRAGAAAANLAAELMRPDPPGSPVLVLAGPGNNGGDGLECGCRLAERGYEVTVLHFADTAKLSEDARQAFERATRSRIQFKPTNEWRSVVLGHRWALIVDGLFGIGLMRPLSGPTRELIECLNTLACPVLALDIPSGLNADTGNVVGPDGIAVRATHTITFIAGKPGLHTGQGRDFAGTVSVAPLEIDSSLFPSRDMALASPTQFATELKPRLHASHKGTFGDVVVLGGAHGMSGAVILAARTAAKCGAGRVFAAFLGEAPAYDPLQPELMFRSAQSIAMGKAALVVGPGLGTTPQAREIVLNALRSETAAIFDADALNLIAKDSELQEVATVRKQAPVFTPHPLEAARLLGTTTADVQADRPAAARRLAKRFNVIAVLKGSGTIIARPCGLAAINPTGNPALATGGSGDVLAGVCGALLAQGWPAWEAALCAVWSHGKAADDLVDQGVGPIGFTASELIPQLRTVLNQLVAEVKPAALRQS